MYTCIVPHSMSLPPHLPHLPSILSYQKHRHLKWSCESSSTSADYSFSVHLRNNIIQHARTNYISPEYFGLLESIDQKQWSNAKVCKRTATTIVRDKYAETLLIMVITSLSNPGTYCCSIRPSSIANNYYIN